MKMPISNPKQDLHNINAHTKFCKNTLIFTQVIFRKWKYGRMDVPTDWLTEAEMTNVILLYPATSMWQGIKVINKYLKCQQKV